VVQAARSKRLRWMQPLPLVALRLGPCDDGVASSRTRREESVFHWGRASFSWSRSDSASRRLAAVQLVDRCRQPAPDICWVRGDETTLWRWRSTTRRMASSRFSMRRRDKAPLGADRGEGGRDPPAAAGRKQAAGDRLSHRVLAQQRPESDRRPVRRQHSAPDDARAARATRQAARPLGRAVGGTRGTITEAKPVVWQVPPPFAGALVVLPALAADGSCPMLPRRSTGSDDT